MNTSGDEIVDELMAGWDSSRCRWAQMETSAPFDRWGVPPRPKPALEKRKALGFRPHEVASRIGVGSGQNGPDPLYGPTSVLSSPTTHLHFRSMRH